MNEGIHLDLDTWIVPGQIRKANLCRGLGTDIQCDMSLSCCGSHGLLTCSSDDIPHPLDFAVRLHLSIGAGTLCTLVPKCVAAVAFCCYSVGPGTTNNVRHLSPSVKIRGG